MVNAVVTLQVPGKTAYQELARRTEPLFIDYANRYGHDYVVIRDRKFPDFSPHFEKYQIRDLLGSYERVCYFDIDVLLAGDCPDLFDVVPTSEFGCYDTDLHPNREEYLSIVEEAARLLEFPVPVNYRRFHFNSGIMVISRIHGNLFNLDWSLADRLQGRFRGFEQIFLNATALGRRIPMYFLDEKYHWIPWHQQDRVMNKPYAVHLVSVNPLEERIRQIDHLMGIWEMEGRLPASAMEIKDEAGVPIWQVQRLARKRLRELEYRARQESINAVMESRNN